MDNMMLRYRTQAVSPDLLSMLDVATDGKVVSAETWATLWNTVLKRINNIDAYCVDIEATRIDWEKAKQDLRNTVDAIKQGFVHYGEEPPTNEDILFWVRPCAKQTPATIPDVYYDPSSLNAQSGIAVAEAINSTKDDIYNSFSNSLKSTKSGAVITADDVSPLEHSLKVKLTSDTVTDFSGVSVYRYGKNLIPFPYSTGNVTVNGVSFTDNGDGSITLNGTATAFATYDLTKALKLVAGQTYCLSDNNTKLLTIVYTGADGSIGYESTNINKGTFIWEEGRTVNSIYLNVPPNSKFDGVTIYPMLELGSAPTEYEAYRSAINVTANADGTVNGLISVAPNMTLFSDNDEVIIHCEYNKDINSFKGGAAVEVDQVYDPVSSNAQSGKAVAPVLQKKLAKWQPNTEYKVGDVVVGKLFMGYSEVTNILVCKKVHTSGAEMMDTVTAVDYWTFEQVVAESSNSAVTDGIGNIITDTYATKEELNTAIGDIETALDGIIAIQNELIGGNT